MFKSVITNVLEYKAALNLKFKCVCVAMYSLVMSPFSRDFLIMDLQYFNTVNEVFKHEDARAWSLTYLENGGVFIIIVMWTK